MTCPACWPYRPCARHAPPAPLRELAAVIRRDNAARGSVVAINAARTWVVVRYDDGAIREMPAAVYQRSHSAVATP